VTEGRRAPRDLAVLRIVRVAIACLWSFVAFVLFAKPAAAHTVSVSQGDYTVLGREASAHLVFARPSLVPLAASLDANGDGVVLPGELERARPELDALLAKGIVARADGKPCASQVTEARLLEEDGIGFDVRYTCAAPGDPLPYRVEFTLPILEDLIHGHRHIAHAKSGAFEVTVHLFRGHASVEVPVGSGVAGAGSGGKDAPASPSGFGGFVAMGADHIWTGYDHLLFLFALVLVGGRVRSLMATITAFTVAHSLTLALAVLDVWTPRPAYVEALIALSIAYVGVENFYVKGAANRWRITFPFGLVHGFGFAAGLKEIELPKARIPIALLGFNVGVELGQLAVVLPLFALIVLFLRKRAWFAVQPDEPPPIDPTKPRLTAYRVASAAVVVCGLGWFVERVILVARGG
jgi:hypothetical protein